MMMETISWHHFSWNISTHLHWSTYWPCSLPSRRSTGTDEGGGWVKEEMQMVPRHSLYLMMRIPKTIYNTNNSTYVYDCMIISLQVGKDRALGYDPCTLSWFSRGEYVVVGGASKQCCLHTKEGVRLGVIGDQSTWVWSTAVKPDSNYVVRCCLKLLLFGKIWFQASSMC